MISVVIPTYNQRGKGAYMLTQLLNSVYRQTGVIFEVCVSDNDDTIKAVVDKYPGIRYQHNPVKGASENINAAIGMASYDKIKLMCQDDMFNTTGALKLYSEALDSHGWAISDSVHVNENGGTTGKRIANYNPNNFDSNTVGMPSVIAFRKNDLRFDERLKTFCDVYFYYQLYQLYGMPVKIAGFNIAQRFHNASQSRNQPPSHTADKNFLISNGMIPGKTNKVVVAVVAYNRLENVERWFFLWQRCNTANAELVFIVNNDNGKSGEGQYNDGFIKNVKVIQRPNIGYDIGAFQDVCKNRLPGFPDYDYLLWCTDDTIPMAKDFITPFIGTLNKPRVGIACMQVSNEYARHVRTTGFCIKKETASKLRFPADPITTKQHCLYFEHRGKNNALLAQIEAMRLKVVQVAPLQQSPLYDMGFWYRNPEAKRYAASNDRMNEHNKIFNSNVQTTH